MAYYGNILIVYEEGSHGDVKDVLQNNNTQYEQVASSFFIETSSLDNTAGVIKDLNSLGISFLFFHNRISDGSLIRTNKMDKDIVDRINEILFK